MTPVSEGLSKHRAAVIALFEPRFGTLAFMLLFLLGRVGRRLGAKTEPTP